MSREVQYLITGRGHIPYLLVSLMTLRRFYRGPVVIHAWPESIEVVRQLADDPRLCAQAVQRKPFHQGLGRNDTFVDKTSVANVSGVDERVFLDADTIIESSAGVDGLFAALSEHDMAATQFCDWLTTSPTIQGRLQKLTRTNRPPIDPYIVQKCMDHPYPSLNCGVFACRPGTEIMRVWEAWTWAARKEIIPDELTQHVLPVLFPDRVVVMPDGLWNGSHKHGQAGLEAYIWHGHGHSFVRPEKSPKAVDAWWPLWLAALKDNLGGVRNWPTMHCGNRHLQDLMGVRL